MGYCEFEDESGVCCVAGCTNPECRNVCPACEGEVSVEADDSAVAEALVNALVDATLDQHALAQEVAFLKATLASVLDYITLWDEVPDALCADLDECLADYDEDAV